MTETTFDALYRMVARFPCLGGILVAAPGGRLPFRTADGTPVTTITPSTDADRLTRSPDVEATLVAGRLRYRRGLLESGGTSPVVLQRSHAFPRVLLHRVIAWIDAQPVSRRPFLVVYDPEEAPAPAPIAVRLAFSVIADKATPVGLPAAEEPDRLPPVDLPEHLVEEAVRAALARGVADPFGEYLTLRAAQAHAAMSGRSRVTEADLAWAVRMVLDPRAAAPASAVHASAETLVSPTEDAAPAPDGRDDPRSSLPQTMPAPDRDGHAQSATSAAPEGTGQGDDTAVPAASVAESGAPLPSTAPTAPPVRRRSDAPAPARRRAGRHGPSRYDVASERSWRLPAAANPRRIDPVATIRAAAPWQRIRPRRPGVAVTVLPDDLRYRRFCAPRAELLMILLDASASMWPRAITRAKGYALRLVDEAYRRRADVALIAVRGIRPLLLVAPGRRYTAVRQAVRTLPVGGGTPLSAALQLARRIAAPYADSAHVALWLLTDGRGPLLPPRLPGPEAHGTHPLRDDTGPALESYRAEWERIGAACHVVDFAPRGSGATQQLAAALGARFVVPEASTSRSGFHAGEALLRSLTAPPLSSPR